MPDAVHRRLTRSQPVTTLTSLVAVDRMLREAETRFDNSADDAYAFLAAFELDTPAMPPDPFSARYRAVQWDLYREVAQRDTYETENERSSFNVPEAELRPFPYQTGSPVIVGDQLIAYGFIIKTLGLPAGARIVEFGAGWGNLAIHFAQTGYHVTVVDVDPSFRALLHRRSTPSSPLTVVGTDMLAFETIAPYDAAVFFESFHHCSDHLGMLDRLHRIVALDGVVALAAEPIGPMPYPWGLRLDGLSLWSTRRYGWLELGFDTRYFKEALRRTGWTWERVRSRTISPLTNVVLARGAGPGASPGDARGYEARG
jgi:SAM-dependent methyltransferase